LLEKKHEIITLADEMNKIIKEEKEQTEEEQVHRVVPVDTPASVPILLTPTVDQEVQIFTDDVPVELKPLKLKLKLKLKQSKKSKVKHENRIPYVYNNKEADWRCKKCGEEIEPHTVEAWDAHICNEEEKEKEKEKELEVVIMTDDIPFQNQNQTGSKATFV
jgi:hypothetical protein